MLLGEFRFSQLLLVVDDLLLAGIVQLTVHRHDLGVGGTHFLPKL